MKIDLYDATDLAVKDVHYLSDHIIRFQLEVPRKPSDYETFVLGEFSSLDEIFPSAPNRSAVEYNLNTWKESLDAILRSMGHDDVANERAITSIRGLMSFYIDHFLRPSYLFTNNQAIISLVQRNEARLEILHHSSLRQFENISPDCCYGGLPGPEQVVIVRTLDQAEAVAREYLSKVEISTLRLRRARRSTRCFCRVREIAAIDIGTRWRRY